MFSCGDNVSVILKSLEDDMKILLRWFSLNSLKANPGKFQFMIFGKSIWPKDCLAIESIGVKDSDHVEVLGITTDKHLSVKKHIENLFRYYKLHARRHIRQYLTVKSQTFR